jgi:regulator of extracellular matrix RemA (YlzA/DUF370 family)
LHVGFDQFIDASRILGVASLASSTIKQTIKSANTKGLLIDLTQGHKNRAAIILDDGRIFLVSRAPEIIAGRLRASQVGSPSELIEEK